MAKHLETKTGERTFVFEFTEQETAFLATVFGHVNVSKLVRYGPTRLAIGSLGQLLDDLANEDELDKCYVQGGSTGEVHINFEIPVSVLK